MTTFGQGQIDLRKGDCLEILATLADCSIDSIVTDPPYHLTTNKKGGSGAASINLKTPYERSRIGTGNGAGGFMGRAWDGGDIAFRVELWTKMLRVLKPGGHLVAFSAPRCSHRMVCAIEDAGFEIRDGLMWMFGTGFPKSCSIEGFEGFGTALKPAYEPICLARKPLDGTNLANMQTWGVGAMNIDACRVGGEPLPSAAMRATRPPPSSCRSGEYGDGHAIQNRISPERWATERPGEQIGRWPANVVHDGSDEVVSAFPDSAGQLAAVGPQHGARLSVNVYGDYGPRPLTLPRNDSGSAARFFYSAKASKHDRAGSKHPTVKPVSLMRWLCRLVTPPNGLILDAFAGSGTTGAAAHLEGFRAILIERETEYQEDIERRLHALCGEDPPWFKVTEAAE